MAIISQKNLNEQGSKHIMSNFFQKIKLGTLLKNSNIRKTSGVSPVSLFQYIFGLVFLNRNHYEAMQESQKAFAQDTVYRFINEGSYNWEKFLVQLAMVVINIIRTWRNSYKQPSVLIIDDTPFYRDRSKKVELLSWFRDYTENRSFRGFKMLTMAWTDGISTIPCMFRMVATQKIDKLICPARQDLDKRTLAAKRRHHAQKTKPELVVDMLTQAANLGIMVNYVLMDSWFYQPPLMKQIDELGFYSIIRMKQMGWNIFRLNSRFYTLGALYQIASKKAKSHYCSIVVDMKIDEETILPIRISFAPNQNKKGEWIAIASTDITLAFEEIIRIYGMRWNIETMFQICKSDLRLASEFQSRSFDAIVASTTIVLSRYICLALEHRSDTDPRAWGELFRACLDEIVALTFHEALSLVMLHTAAELAEYFKLNIREVQERILLINHNSPSPSLSLFPALRAFASHCVS